jgi:hypothetical protein
MRRRNSLLKKQIFGSQQGMPANEMRPGRFRPGRSRDESFNSREDLGPLFPHRSPILLARRR